MFMTLDRISRTLLCGCVSGIIAEIFYIIGLANFWSFLVTLWVISAATYLGLATVKLPAEGKAVLITGCDSGFGHELAKRLHSLGFRVFAACLLSKSEGEGAEKLKQIDPERLHVLQLDITSQDDITNAVNSVKQNLKDNEVFWGLVNNAAINTHGAVEWVPMETYSKVLNVNVLGTIAVTKAFLPLIRKAEGRVVNVTSCRGRMGSPHGTTYDVTKYGLEGFSEGLRQEMRPWNVNVCIIEPGNFTAGTRIFTKKQVEDAAEKMWKMMDDSVKEDYGKEYFDESVAKQMGVTQSGDPDLSIVTEAMEDALTQRFPQERYQPMDPFCFLMVFASQHFPECVYDYVFIEYFMKKGWPGSETDGN